MKILLCWSPTEDHSWNPDLAAGLRSLGEEVVEVHDLTGLEALDATGFDLAMPRFRMGSAEMACLDERLVRSGLPMLNSRRCRRSCENKAIAHLAFEDAGLRQPRSFVLSAEGLADRQIRWSGETILKPLFGNRGAGMEILPSFEAAYVRATRRAEDLLVQEMIWPSRCWRIIVGRRSGIVDAYWRRPAGPGDRILSISTGATIVREPPPDELRDLSCAMTESVGGDILAVDILEDPSGRGFALEINHNFDAHGGTPQAVAAFQREAERITGTRFRVGDVPRDMSGSAMS